MAEDLGPEPPFAGDVAILFEWSGVSRGAGRSLGRPRRDVG